MSDSLEKATPIGGVTPGGYRRVAAEKYVKVSEQGKETAARKEAKRSQKEAGRAAAAGGTPWFLREPKPGEAAGEAHAAAKEAEANKPVDATAQVKRMITGKASDTEVHGVVSDLPTGSKFTLQFVQNTSAGPKSVPVHVQKTGNDSFELTHGPTGDKWSRNLSQVVSAIRQSSPDLNKSLAGAEDEAVKARDDGKPGESLGEVDTSELEQTLSDIVERLKDEPDDKGLQAREAAISAELKRRGGSEDEAEKARKMPSAESDLSPEKARQMLHEGSGGHGRPITDKQRRFFGALGGHLPAPGGKAQKSMDPTLEDWLEKATPIGGITPGGYKRVGPKKYVKVSKTKANLEAQQGAKTESGMAAALAEAKRQKEARAKEAASKQPESAKPAEAGDLPEPKVSKIGNATVRDYGAKGAISSQKFGSGELHSILDEDGHPDPKRSYHSLAQAEAALKGMKKSMDPTLEDWLEKATPIGGITPGGYKRISKTEYVPVKKDIYHKEQGKSGPEVKLTRPITKEEFDALPVGTRIRPGIAQNKTAVKTHSGMWQEEVPISGGRVQIVQFANDYYRSVVNHNFSEGYQNSPLSTVALPTTTPVVTNRAYNKQSVKLKQVEEDLPWGYKKSFLEHFDFEKSGGLPTHEPRMGSGKSASVEGGSADGGEVEAVGMTSGSGDSAASPPIGAPSVPSEKLSEDDAEVEKQMTEHTKPIEACCKSRFPADQRESVARQRAQLVSRLQKSDDVYIGPGGHPLSLQALHGPVDEAAAELVKSEGFYTGGSPQMAAPAAVIGRGVLCKSVNSGGCASTYNAALTACPECGAGSVGHRSMPGAPMIGASQMVVENDRGPGPLLRQPAGEPDIRYGV